TVSGLGWVRLSQVVAVRPRAGSDPDSLFRADSVAVALDLGSLLSFRARVGSLGLWHARIRLPARHAAEFDTLMPDDRTSKENPARAARLRQSAESWVRLLSAPARRLPRLELNDVEVSTGNGEDASIRGLQIARLDLKPFAGGIRFSTAGSLQLERGMPFSATFTYDRENRIRGGAQLLITDSTRARTDTLLMTADGSLRQDYRRGVVTIGDGTRLTIGRLPLRIEGRLESTGPVFRLAVRADSLTEEKVTSSLPRAVLGPLLDVGIRGSWDYRVALDLDLARPDSVQFEADVIPHQLVLDPARTRLRLVELGEPFVAVVLLPRGARSVRELSANNPHFRTLDTISPHLVHAVVTNEDGGFFRHRGFNIEAMKEAIAENLKAGAFRRGAGTITMQLARNLYTGHARTLSRKGQEIVLAWMLEHLTGVSKERLLEIYLNIIQWGPGIHGVDEAARFYFDRDARDLTLDQSLFLSTIIPSPSRWRWRFDSSGTARDYVKAQMHFIGRAMIAKGWLAPDALPSTESLRVELAGPARAVFFPDTTGGDDQDSTGD
ncbi:MAG TPA: biosynthetic peptidoglycan transglycosylase, partial [Candidatus Eisenbacteria bacterium]|nr:biosynthetic peptidoglycan transglycosylase [Candidatus Eisenbacteria bacterium]